MLRDAQALIERCIRLEQKAWEEFIERFSGLLYYSARERLRRNRIGFSEQDIEDIVQGVFLEIWEKKRLAEVRDRKKITSWLSIMGQTRALNFMQKKRERLLREDELYKVDNIKAESHGHCSEELMQELDKAIQGFSVKERMILKLNIIYGKTHKEIARFMHLPINTVSTIIARRKKALRQRLKDF